jgi:hypothetical protein
VDEGKPPNPVKTVICDPGSREFKAWKPGLFYTIISRGTTMGTLQNGKWSGSAIYFYDYGFGSVMTPAWITNLRVSLKTNQTYVTISKRDKWVSHLQKNKVQRTQRRQWSQGTIRMGKTQKGNSQKSGHTTPHKIKIENKNQIN